MSMMSSIKQALGGHKKEKTVDTAAEPAASPLATGAHRLEVMHIEASNRKPGLARQDFGTKLSSTVHTGFAVGTGLI
jgi:hypothetical protein